MFLKNKKLSSPGKTQINLPLGFNILYIFTKVLRISEE
jgi:hypothetical protein